MKYIVVEGLDASGKTTQSKMLVEHLISQGKKAVWSREPGSPLISDYLNVRDLILSHKKLSQQALELLLIADRAEHTTKVKELIEQGTYVVADRSYISGLAYGTACGNNFETLMSLYSYAIQIYPDHVFILNMPLEEAEKRRQLRNETATREEVKGCEFKLQVQQNFLNLCNAGTNPKTQFHVIDATKPVTEIFNQISALI